MARLARRTVSVVSKPTAVLLPMLPRNLVEPQAPVPGPNILIIVNESLRRDHMHVFGYERANTPYLDAFFAQHAAQIYDFPHAFSTAASTLFSWTSLLTGRYLVQSRETLGEVSLPWHYARAVGKSSFFVSPQNWTWMGMKDFFLTFDPPDYYADATAFDSPVVNDTGVDDLIAAQAAIDRLSVYAQDDTPFLGILQTNATHFPFMHEESAPWPQLRCATDMIRPLAMLIGSSVRLLRVLTKANCSTTPSLFTRPITPNLCTERPTHRPWMSGHARRRVIRCSPIFPSLSMFPRSGRHRLAWRNFARIPSAWFQMSM